MVRKNAKSTSMDTKDINKIPMVGQDAENTSMDSKYTNKVTMAAKVAMDAEDARASAWTPGTPRKPLLLVRTPRKPP